MTLKELVILKRTENGLSQRELAKKMGVSNSTVSRIENGAMLVPDISTLKSLSEALDIDYYYLLSLSGILDDSPETRIFKGISELNESEKEKLMDVLNREFPGRFINTEKY